MDRQFEIPVEIDLMHLWKIIKTNVFLILNITLVVMILAAGASFFVLDKQYESYTTLMLGKPTGYQTTSGNSNITYSDILLNQQLVATYSEIAKSRVVTSTVIENLKLDMTNTKLASLISVTTQNDTEIIRITVKYGDPIKAAKIANEMAITFSNYTKVLMKIDNINVVDVAAADNKYVSPAPFRNIFLAGIIGMILGLITVLLRESLDTRVKEPEDVNTVSSYPVLTMIPFSEMLEEGGEIK
ncbi:MAG: lipopolysaccharide biosynthesis protein [Eubacteriaceae bacterium]|nr:lipopolysaccharide biosynthesis protein [Eubacteriaceae bacterium]